MREHISYLISANMSFIPSIAEMKKSNKVQSVNLSSPDCSQENNPVLKCPSGNKCKRLAKYTRTNPVPVPPNIWKSDSSMKNKESAQPSNASDLSDKLSSEVKKRTIEYDNATDWENGLDSLHTEDEMISILNIVSCIENERRGFGSRSNDECYWEEREADEDNRLYEEAIYGLELLERGRERRAKRPKYM